MEDNPWLLEHAVLRHRRYLVILVRHGNFPEPVSQEILRHIHEFGALMQDKGAVVIPYDSQIATTFAEVLAKDWPPEVLGRMQQTDYPFLLILDQDFRAFDPAEAGTGSALVWFEEFEDAPERSVWKIFNAIAREVREDRDLFAWLDDAARRARAERRAEAIADHVEVKIPIVPGIVEIKASALLARLARFL